MAAGTLVDISRLKDVLFGPGRSRKLPPDVEEQLAGLAKAATEEVETHCGSPRRRFIPVTLTNVYDTTANSILYIEEVLPPASSITVSAWGRPLLLGTDWVPVLNPEQTAYWALRRVAGFIDWPWTAWTWGLPYAAISVTGKHGYMPEPPQSVKEVALAIAVRMYNTQHFAFRGNAGAGASGVAIDASLALWDDYLEARIAPYKRPALIVMA